MSITQIVQAIVGAALALLLFFGGRSCGASASVERIAEKDRALLVAAQSLRDASAALHQVNTNAAQEEAAAAERQREADFAKERALMAAEDLRRDLKRAESDLADAMRAPGCRAELEKPTCAALR
ncbi:hypothetical protein ACHZ97_14665 [Lysobacter soli]|uniref:hypothetical protein n=1 Tax=Lysobacter soli TaxID=453783 RepID=UPI0037CB0B9A